MADTLEEVTLTGTRQPPRPAPRPLIFGELADQELDRVLLNLQDNLLQQNTLTTTSGAAELADDALESVEVRAERAFAQARPEARSYLINQTQRMVDFVAPQVERVLRLTGEIPQILIDRYGEGIVDMAAEQVRAAEAAARAAAAAAERVLPEVVMTGARVGSSTSFGLASLIPEAAYYLGSYLSDLALRGAVDRITPPPVGLLPDGGASEPAPEPRRPAATPVEPPTDFQLPPVDVLGARPPRPLEPVFPVPTFINPPISFVTPGDLATPGPLDRPVNLPVPAPRPLPAPAPGPFTFADPLTFAPPTSFPSPSSPPGSFGAPRPTPTGLPGPTFAGAPQPGPLSPPNQDRCNCAGDGGQKKKKRKKKKPRDVCYRGTYYESATSLTKYRKERISCQRSK